MLVPQQCALLPGMPLPVVLRSSPCPVVCKPASSLQGGQAAQRVDCSPGALGTPSSVHSQTSVSTVDGQEGSC